MMRIFTLVILLLPMSWAVASSSGPALDSANIQIEDRAAIKPGESLLVLGAAGRNLVMVADGDGVERPLTGQCD